MSLCGITPKTFSFMEKLFHYVKTATASFTKEAFSFDSSYQCRLTGGSNGLMRH